MLNIKIGKTVVRGKEKYSLVEQKELVSKLAGKYKKGCDKVVKALQKKTHYPYKRKKKRSNKIQTKVTCSSCSRVL